MVQILRWYLGLLDLLLGDSQLSTLQMSNAIQEGASRPVIN